jgi:hypothetical protein
VASSGGGHGGVVLHEGANRAAGDTLLPNQRLALHEPSRMVLRAVVPLGGMYVTTVGGDDEPDAVAPALIASLVADQPGRYVLNS